MKETIIRRYPDGTRATYRLEPGSPHAAPLLTPMKLPRTRWARTEKRRFPGYLPGCTSTADYVRCYFSMNTDSRARTRICAYPDHVDHLALYAPLPDTPAAVYTGVDSVETIEEDAA